MRNTYRNNSSRGNDRREDRQMHRATCADCGRSCEVPFRPTGDKPVYCSNCFRRDDEPRRDDRRDNRRDERRDDRRDDRQMFRATCADCGNSCEVPFRPSSDKPVYCTNCFSRDDRQTFKSQAKVEKSNKKHDGFDAKLDKILSLLERLVASKEKAPQKAAEKPVAELPIKAPAKKVASKKEVKKVTKKSVAKKSK